MATRVLSAEEQKSIIESLKAWTWRPLSIFIPRNENGTAIAGATITTSPASAGGDDSETRTLGKLTCVMSREHNPDGSVKARGSHPVYLLSLKAGITDDGSEQCPHQLLQLVSGDQEVFLRAKNMYQITVSFVPAIRQQDAGFLDIVCPQWRTILPAAEGAKATKVNMMPTVQQRLKIGISYSGLFTKKGTAIFNCLALESAGLLQGELVDAGGSNYLPERTSIQSIEDKRKALLAAAGLTVGVPINSGDQQKDQQVFNADRKAPAYTPLTARKAMKDAGHDVSVSEINKAVSDLGVTLDELVDAVIADGWTAVVG